MLYDIKIDGVMRKVVGHYGRNGFYYTLDRTNGKFIKSEKYVNDLNWTKGIDQKTGKPFEYNPKLDVQLYNPEARALRGDGTEAHLPDVARRRRAPAARVQPGQEHRLRRRHRRVLLAERRGGGVASDRTAASTTKTSEPRQVQQRPLLRRGDGVRRRRTTRCSRKAVTDIEIRSGVDRDGRRPGVHRAAGRLGRRLQRRDARGAVALQRRHAAQGRAGHLRDRTEAVSRGADRAAATCTR